MRSIVQQRVTKEVRPPSLQGSGNGMIAPLMRMIRLELVLHGQEVLAANELEGRDKLEQGDKVEGREESEEEEGGHVEEGEEKLVRKQPIKRGKAWSSSIWLVFCFSSPIYM